MSFDAQLLMTESTARITLTGSVDAGSALRFKEVIEQAAAQKAERLVLLMDKLDFLSAAGLNVLIFAKQKLGPGVDIYVVGGQAPVLDTLEMSGFHHSLNIQGSYAEA